MSKLNTKNTSSEVESLFDDTTVERHKDTTGTDVGAKRGLDTVSLGGATEYMPAILALIQGTMPEINWNQIQKTTNSLTSFSYLFSYNDNQQFLVTITDAFSDFNVSITSYSNLISEDGFAIGLEGGGELFLEG